MGDQEEGKFSNTDSLSSSCRIPSAIEKKCQSPPSYVPLHHTSPLSSIAPLRPLYSSFFHSIHISARPGGVQGETIP